MKKNGAHDEEQLWFDAQMKVELTRFDQAFGRQEPDITQLEALVADHRNQLRRKQWRELALFWFVAVIVLIAILGVLDRNWTWFVALQCISAVGALAFIGISSVKRRDQSWKNG